MCHYVTAVLPQTTNLDALSTIAGKHHRMFLPQPNPTVERQLQKGERYFLTTVGQCDCGTSFGSRGHDESTQSRSPEGEANRLRAKGWSEPKIARSLAQKAGAIARAEVNRNTHDTTCDTNCALFIEDILASRHTTYLGLLLHWYSGPLSGRINVTAREVVKRSKLSVVAIAEAKADILYVFTVAP